MDKKSPITDELIEQAQDGDQDSFGEIFEYYLAPVYRYVFFRVGDEQNAEKLTEEVFLKLWNNIKKFRSHGKTPFAVWIFQVSHRIVSNFHDRVKKTKAARKRQHEQPPEENGIPEEKDRNALFEALSTLPNTQAESIILKYFCNLATAEIGTILEKTEGAVRILQSRGLKKIRELLEENELE